MKEENMRYYRIAIQPINGSSLKWKSVPFTSLETLFRFLRFYKTFPQDRLRVFTASSREELDDMLAQENKGLATKSIPSMQFLRERGISSSRCRQEEENTLTAPSSRTNTGTFVPLSQNCMQESVLTEQGVSVLEKRRFELEMGVGGDHDQPYTFALPVPVSQWLAQTRLMVRIQQGQLQP